MAYRSIPIPGGTTTFEEAPVLRIRGGGNRPLELKVTYTASAKVNERPVEKGEVIFRSVLEFRWIEFDFIYDEIPLPPDDDYYSFGLIEVLNSEYVARMASMGHSGDCPGERFGAIPEADVRHFRMTFDDWGVLNVIALSVEARSVKEKGRVKPRLDR